MNLAMRNLMVVGLIVTAGLSIAFAQQSAGGTNTAPPKPISGSSGVGSMFTGSVMMDDGSPTPGAVDIQVVCGSSSRTIAHTTPAGDFEFQWNALSQSAPVTGVNSFMSAMTASNSDASAVVHSNIQDQAEYCDLRAHLPGYESSEINLNNPSAFDGMNVGVIWLRKLGAHQGNMVSVLTLQAPKEAKKFFDKGNDLLKAGKLTDAADNFQKAVTLYPKYPDAWLTLGRIQYKMRSNDAARSSLQRALELDGKLVGTWQILGYMASDQQRWGDAVKYLDHAVELAPGDSPLPYFISAVAYYHLQKFDDAEKSIRREISLDPHYENRRARYLYGLILVARDNFDEGASILQTYLSSSPDPQDVESARTVLSRIQTYARK